MVQRYMFSCIYTLLYYVRCMKRDAQCMKRTLCAHFIQGSKMSEVEGYLFRLY